MVTHKELKYIFAVLTVTIMIIPTIINGMISVGMFLQHVFVKSSLKSGAAAVVDPDLAVVW
tara:strand:+ start:69 stop:251 length:183 start_codon:yes stop_codon:yes gene_type:complete